MVYRDMWIKTGKITGVLVLVMILISASIYLIYNEELPEGEISPAADSLAVKMLRAVNHEAYQNTRFLSWSYAGHQYLWDKRLHEVEVSWDNQKVLLYTKTPEKSTVWINNQLIDDPDSQEELVEQATKYFNNDSFWLVAPHKVFDPGTERRLVNQTNEQPALVVTYTSGGTTPGDSYLWLLDDSGRPYAWKMWVSILPIGGLEATWEGWKTTESGTLLPTMHEIFSMEFGMGEVRGWN